MAAAREPGAGVTTRQNLALALALAGEWGPARAVAAADLSPADVDARMAQWAAFAQPVSASDQVAALLGVRPAVDPGQPVALALTVPASAPVVAVAAPSAPTPAPVAAPAPTAAVAEPLHLVVPASVAAAPVRPVVRRVPVRATPVTFAAGPWAIQLGTFPGAAGAQGAWTQALRRLPALRARPPITAVDGGKVRLAVGGLSIGSATAACRAYRVRGGSCFVRMGAGETVAAWARPARPVQLASR
jgi:hypothetical protein